jgi:hypothetical protein
MKRVTPGRYNQTKKQGGRDWKKFKMFGLGPTFVVQKQGKKKNFVKP